MHSFHGIRVFILLNMCIQITEHAIFRPPIFCGVFFVYAGTINRPLQLLVVCHFVANGLLIMQRSPTKIGCEHPARRRGPIHRARILT